MESAILDRLIWEQGGGRALLGPPVDWSNTDLRPVLPGVGLHLFRRPNPMADSLHDLSEKLRQFAQARDWAQFHSPKNLASALTVEASELLEHFQWMTEAQSRALNEDKRAAVGLEIADVLMYLIQLANSLGVDPIALANEKLAVNERRYPVELSRGSSKKYDEL